MLKKYLLLIFLLVSSSIIGEGFFKKVDRVIDGDTFVLESGEKVRMIGIDSPECNDPNKPVEYFCEESTEHLKKLIEGKLVHLEFGDERTDKYNRLLCYIWDIDGAFINLKMIEEGYAMAYLRFPHAKEEQFLKAEITARRNAIGMWASPRSQEPKISGKERLNELLNDSIKTDYDRYIEAKAKQEKESKNDDDVIVYITKTGSKYHRGSCSYLKKSKIPISKKEAIARGYTPCSKCRP